MSQRFRPGDRVRWNAQALASGLGGTYYMDDANQYAMGVVTEMCAGADMVRVQWPRFVGARGAFVSDVEIAADFPFTDLPHVERPSFHGPRRVLADYLREAGYPRAALRVLSTDERAGWVLRAAHKRGGTWTALVREAGYAPLPTVEDREEVRRTRTLGTVTWTPSPEAMEEMRRSVEYLTRTYTEMIDRYTQRLRDYVGVDPAETVRVPNSAYGKTTATFREALNEIGPVEEDDRPSARKTWPEPRGRKGKGR